jgi:hypothetical protein
MLSVQTHLFGVTFQSHFPEPVPLSKANIDDTAQKVLTALRPLGLKASQFQVVKGDELFGYELKLNMFQGNGTVSLNAERIEISFANARSRDDFRTIARCLVDLYQSIPSQEAWSTLVNAYLHAGIESASQRDEYFSRFGRVSENIAIGGIIVYGKTRSWDEEIRLQIDRLLASEPGLFLNWTTKFASGKVSEETLKRLWENIEELLKACEIEIS